MIHKWEVKTSYTWPQSLTFITEPNMSSKNWLSVYWEVFMNHQPCINDVTCTLTLTCSLNINQIKRWKYLIFWTYREFLTHQEFPLDIFTFYVWHTNTNINSEIFGVEELYENEKVWLNGNLKKYIVSQYFFRYSTLSWWSL